MSLSAPDAAYPSHQDKTPSSGMFHFPPRSSPARFMKYSYNKQACSNDIGRHRLSKLQEEIYFLAINVYRMKVMNSATLSTSSLTYTCTCRPAVIGQAVKWKCSPSLNVLNMSVFWKITLKMPCFHFYCPILFMRNIEHRFIQNQTCLF